jgi:hypothetical protein
VLFSIATFINTFAGAVSCRRSSNLKIDKTNAANAVELESPKFYYFCHEPGYYM